MARRKLTPEEKQRLLEEKINNENSILDVFSSMPCFAGIDKCKLSLQDFSVERVEIKNLNQDSSCNLKTSIDGELLSLDIKSEFFGKITISFDTSDFKTPYCYIELIHGGLNFETVGIKGIKNRLSNAIDFIKNNYGIIITYSTALFLEIELAYTIAFDKTPNLQLRSFLHKCLSSGNSPNFGNEKSKKDNYDYPILSCKISTDELTVFYDKIEKAKRKRQIRREGSKLENINVQRFELVLKKNKIKELLGTNSLDLLNDAQLIEYLESKLHSTINVYIKLIEKSSSKTKKVLEDVYRKYGPKKYIKEFLMQVNNYSLTTLSPLVLDEEILALINIGFSKNKGRTKKTIIEHFQNSEKYYSEKNETGLMITWHVRDIFKVFYESLDVAREKGLGCHKDTTSTHTHKHSLKNYTLDYRNNIFKKIIKSNTRNQKNKIRNHVLEKFPDKDLEINKNKAN